MKVLKISALVLAALGLVIAVYGAAKLSDYQKVDKAWKTAADQSNDMLRMSRDPSGAVDPAVRPALTQMSVVVDQLYDVRTKARNRCQRVVQFSIIPIALGLILGIIGLARKPRGWLPIPTTLCALIAGGLVGSMLGAGVF